MNRDDVHKYIDKVFGGLEKGQRSGLVIRDAEVAFALAVTADLFQAAPCTLVECWRCNAVRTVWWEWCNSLSTTTRIRLQRHLRVVGIPLPDAPSEDVPSDALPTSLV